MKQPIVTIADPKVKLVIRKSKLEEPWLEINKEVHGFLPGLKNNNLSIEILRFLSHFDLGLSVIGLCRASMRLAYSGTLWPELSVSDEPQSKFKNIYDVFYHLKHRFTNLSGIKKLNMHWVPYIFCCVEKMMKD